MVQLVLLIKLPSFKNCNMFKFAFINFNYNFICILKQNIHIYVAYGWNDWADIFCGHSIFFNPNFFQNIVFLQFFSHGQRRALQLVLNLKKWKNKAKMTKARWFLHRFRIVFWTYLLPGSKLDIVNERQIFRIKDQQKTFAPLTLS